MKREVNMYDSETALYRQKWYYRNLVIIELQKPELFLRKGVLKICSKFTGEYSCQSAITIKLQRKFIYGNNWHFYRSKMVKGNKQVIYLNYLW